MKKAPQKTKVDSELKAKRTEALNRLFSKQKDETKQQGNASNLEITYKAVNDLNPNGNNARIHSKKQISKIKQSIKEFGLNLPIAVDSNGVIIAGHAVWQAAKELEFKDIPTVELGHLNEKQKRAFMIAVNKLAEESGWDQNILKLEFEFLLEQDFDLSYTGFEIPQIDLVINNAFIETGKNKGEKIDKADVLPEKSKIQARVKKGDLYQLGDSFVYCGDSLQKESFQILMSNYKADMVITDPPYNVTINGHVCGKGKTKHSEFAMASGEMGKKEFTDFLKTVFGHLVEYSKDGSIHSHFMDWRHMEEMLNAGKQAYTELKNLCVWNKMQGGMGSLYRSQHELVFVFKNGTAAHTNNIELGKHGRYRTNVWDYRGISVTNPGSIEDLKLHPTVKPLAMIMDAILDCSEPGGIILDAFAGSGTTLLAAEKCQRKAYVIEYEPHYCDVILHRYEKMFGQKARLIKNEGAN